MTMELISKKLQSQSIMTTEFITKQELQDILTKTLDMSLMLMLIEIHGVTGIEKID